MEKHTISLLNDYYGVLLTDKQREMLELFYNCDLSLGEIAQQFSVSRQAVRDSILRGEKALLEYESKLNLMKKNSLLMNVAETLLLNLEAKDIKKATTCGNKIKTILED